MRRAAVKHGHCCGYKMSPEYTVWKTMVARCTIKKRKEYPKYGGRGISVCPQWIGPGGFERFLADLGPRPDLSYTLDRIDNAGNYEPGNCRWATRRQQILNRGNTVWVEHEGERITLVDLAEKTGISPKTLHNRMVRGMPDGKTLASPVAKKNGLVVVGAVGKTLREWSAVYGVKASTIRGRLLHGWPPEMAVKTPAGGRPDRK